MKRLNKSIALSAIAATTFSVSGLAQALYDTIHSPPWPRTDTCVDTQLSHRSKSS